MTAPGTRLPHFDAPPVTMVRLSVAFDRLPRIRAAHAGLLWQEIGGPERYPQTEDLYLEPTEDEGFPASTERPSFTFNFPDRPRPTRTALRSADATDAVELQDDELTVVWAQQAGGGPYPRYEHVRQLFSDTWVAWQRVVERHSLGVLRPRQAEIAYVNHIPVGSGWSGVEDLRDVLRFAWLPSPSPLVPALPEDLHLYQRYVLEREGTPYGRLYVSADTAREHGSDKAMSLSLTVRGRPREPDIDGTLEVLDDGHEIIVSTFVTITTEAMHDRWGRRGS